MKLYHFTSFYALRNVGPEGILAVGLKPGPNPETSFDFMLRSPMPACIWLTSNPDMPKGMSSYYEARVAVVISSTDRRLVHWHRYARKHAVEGGWEHYQSSLAKVTREFERWYVYFDAIPLERIADIDYAATSHNEPSSSDDLKP